MCSLEKVKVAKSVIKLSLLIEFLSFSYIWLFCGLSWQVKLPYSFWPRGIIVSDRPYFIHYSFCNYFEDFWVISCLFGFQSIPITQLILTLTSITEERELFIISINAGCRCDQYVSLYKHFIHEGFGRWTNLMYWWNLS